MTTIIRNVVQGFPTTFSLTQPKRSQISQVPQHVSRLPQQVTGYFKQAYECVCNAFPEDITKTLRVSTKKFPAKGSGQAGCQS